MNEIRVGIIGVGFIGIQHIEAVRRVPNTKIIALCEVDIEQAKKVANTWGIEKYYNDIDLFINENKDLDVIHNCTPSAFHFDINKKVIEAGINIFCEKPLTNTLDESQRLVELIDKYNVKGGVNFNYRHNLMVQEMRERLVNNNVGNAWFVYAEYLQDWLLYQDDFDWRVDTKIGGKSRAIADIGSHCFDTLQFIVDDKIKSVEVKRFNKFSTRINNNQEVKVENEDAAIILIEFKSGLQGLIRVSQVSAGKKNAFKILLEASEQSLEWNQEKPDKLWVGNRNRANEDVYADTKYLSNETKKLAILPNGHAVGWADAFKNSIECFYKSLNDNSVTNYVSFKDADYIMKLVDACLLSDEIKEKIVIKGD